MASGSKCQNRNTSHDANSVFDLGLDLAGRLGVEAAGLGMSQEQYALAVLTQALGASAADDVEMENFLRDRQAVPAQEVTAWLRAGAPDGGGGFPKARTVA